MGFDGLGSKLLKGGYIRSYIESRVEGLNSLKGVTYGTI